MANMWLVPVRAKSSLISCGIWERLPRSIPLMKAALGSLTERSIDPSKTFLTAKILLKKVILVLSKKLIFFIFPFFFLVVYFLFLSCFLYLEYFCVLTKFFFLSSIRYGDASRRL